MEQIHFQGGVWWQLRRPSPRVAHGHACDLALCDVALALALQDEGGRAMPGGAALGGSLMGGSEEDPWTKGSKSVLK